jgi:hypothetical protein
VHTLDEAEAVYDYTDEDGIPLYQTVRQVFKNADGTPIITAEGKERRKTPDGRGGGMS